MFKVTKVTKRLVNKVTKNFFFAIVKIINYSVLINGRNFNDEPIADQIKNYDEFKTTATGQEDDY